MVIVGGGDPLTDECISMIVSLSLIFFKLVLVTFRVSRDILPLNTDFAGFAFPFKILYMEIIRHWPTQGTDYWTIDFWALRSVADVHQLVGYLKQNARYV